MSKNKKSCNQIPHEIATAYARLGGGENSVTPIEYFDLDGKLLFINEAGAVNLGGKPSDFVGKGVSEIFPGLADVIKERFRWVAESGVDAKFVDLVELPSGGRWFLTNLQPVEDANGKTVAVQLISIDMTDWRDFEERASLLTKAVEQSSEGIGVVTMDGYLLFANEAMAAMHGYSISELLGKDISIFHLPEQMPTVKVSLKQLRDTGEFKGQIWHTRRDGSVFPALMHNTVLHDESGAEIGMICTMRDITELKKAEEELKASEQKYRAMVENVPGMVYMAEPDWSAEIVSGCEELCGYTQQELDLKQGHWLSIIHPEDKEIVLKANSELKKLRKSIVQVYRIIAKSGDVRWVEDRKTSHFNQDGQFIGTDGIIFDITDSKRIEQNMVVHHEKMQRAEQLASLGTVSATIAHELNQPLTVMRLFLQQSIRALKEGTSRDNIAETMTACLSELAKTATVVDRFRRFARKSAPIYIAEVNLAEIANGIVEILAGTARRQKLKLLLVVKSCPPHIIGNNLELEQMFFVLIQNAMQAADGKQWRELVITISSVDDQVQLTFADTCGGIKKENLKKIFEPFFTTKPPKLGTGLGLCILDRIVKRHGGSVHVESQFGQGTIFYICLPIKN
ncbi:MAG: PAS domain-containing protein [Planctomycetota bacterium]|jgi:PAS domain S-box-containing protein